MMQFCHRVAATISIVLLIALGAGIVVEATTGHLLFSTYLSTLSGWAIVAWGLARGFRWLHVRALRRTRPQGGRTRPPLT